MKFIIKMNQLTTIPYLLVLLFVFHSNVYSASFTLKFVNKTGFYFNPTAEISNDWHSAIGLRDLVIKPKSTKTIKTYPISSETYSSTPKHIYWNFIGLRTRGTYKIPTIKIKVSFKPGKNYNNPATISKIEINVINFKFAFMVGNPKKSICAYSTSPSRLLKTIHIHLCED